MATFFDRSLSLRTIIKEMIENEDHPMSDSEIKECLEEEGVSIARRTVAKYRSMEGILPAHLRQKSSNIMG
jgi:RNA polymerase sigma-54 factor